MVSFITDPNLEERIIAERQAAGADKHDEVWDGVYVITPLADNEHQDLVNDLTAILTISIDWTGLGKVYPGVNVTNRDNDWQHNYRCPDVVVFLNDTKAQNRGTHWYGSPDLAIEIVSPNDRSSEKLPFYADAGVRELMLIDRDPWGIVLHQLQDAKLVEVGRSTIDNTNLLTSQVVPLNWQLVDHEGRPSIRVSHHDGQQQWSIKPDSGL